MILLNKSRRRRRIVIRNPVLAGTSLVGWTFLLVYLAAGSLFLSQVKQHVRLRANRRNNQPSKPPIPIPQVVSFLENWIQQLHQGMEALFEQNPKSSITHLDVWNVFHNHTVETLLPWDQEYLKRIPQRRTDDSIFLSIVSFRDENCFNTLHQAYTKAAHPDHLFVGLNQQNCHRNCRSGVQKKGGTVLVDPDPDCAKLFCESDLGQQYCHQVRVLQIDEDDSLGPMAARFFASKLYNGETWYIQMDAHMIFRDDWDLISVQMAHAAPSDKPVLTHYPPGHKMNIAAQKPTGRLCGAVFHFDTIRMEELGKFDHEGLDVPHFAPFVGAGFLLAPADFLSQVPFDPFLPYIFMGEEIIMSTRLWTAGYDIFSPSQAVVGHMYVRPHKPKFWESVSRFLHNQAALEELVLQRIKYQLGYPESARDLQQVRNVLDHAEGYGMGTKRKLENYMESVGIDVYRKEVIDMKWCKAGTPPENMMHLAHLYKNKTI